MYRALHAGWQWNERRLLSDCLRPEPLPPPPVCEAELPTRYVAVKLYSNDCLPASREISARTHALIEALAGRVPVVMLNAPDTPDDHAPIGQGTPNVLDVSTLLAPSRNLAVQTAIVGAAEGLLTTYGGFAYLGPLLGVPTTALFEVETGNPAHLEVLERTATTLGAPRLRLHNVRSAEPEALAAKIAGA
jgi:hypothetical protein